MAQSQDESQSLTIEGVLNGAYTEPSTDILYAKKIDVDTVLTKIDIIKNMSDSKSEAKTNINNSINKMYEVLSGTDSSKPFYTNTAAQLNIQNMKDIQSEVNNIASISNEINKNEIRSTIDTYNEEMMKLKKNVRDKLLQKAADEFNAQKNEWDGFPIIKTYSTQDGVPRRTDDNPKGCDSPYNDVRWMDDSDTVEYEFEYLGGNSISKEIPDAEGNPTGMTTTRSYDRWKIHKYKKITYAKWFKEITSPLDPTYENIEKQFDDVHATLPYVPSKIPKDDSVDQSRWGINIYG